MLINTVLISVLFKKIIPKRTSIIPRNRMILFIRDSLLRKKLCLIYPPILYHSINNSQNLFLACVRIFVDIFSSNWTANHYSTNYLFRSRIILMAHGTAFEYIYNNAFNLSIHHAITVN